MSGFQAEADTPQPSPLEQLRAKVHLSLSTVADNYFEYVLSLPGFNHAQLQEDPDRFNATLECLLMVYEDAISRVLQHFEPSDVDQQIYHHPLWQATMYPDEELDAGLDEEDWDEAAEAIAALGQEESETDFGFLRIPNYNYDTLPTMQNFSFIYKQLCTICAACSSGTTKKEHHQLALTFAESAAEFLKPFIYVLEGPDDEDDEVYVQANQAVWGMVDAAQAQKMLRVTLAGSLTSYPDTIEPRIIV